MAGSIPAASGRIFMSYRREETAYPAGWLYDRLADRFGSDQVFKDVDSIELGDDFVEVITRAVGACDVLLALIGREWLTITDARGRRRLNNPHDFVRLEIEAALMRKVRVIPILVDGASMPDAAELPKSLARLVRRQALELSPRFRQQLLPRRPRLDRPPSRANRQLPPRPRFGRCRNGRRRNRGRRRAPRHQLLPRPPRLGCLRIRGKPPGTKRRGLSTRARILAGVGVGVVLILVIVTIVDNSRTTSGSVASVVFQDDFFTTANGWPDAGSTRAGDHYHDGAYRIYAKPASGGNVEGSAPTSANSVYPSAPPDVSVQVEARRLAGDQDTGYGIACRANPNNSNMGYVFLIWDGHAEIGKLDGSGYQALKGLDTSTLDADAKNSLDADCNGDEGSVYLNLYVNGQLVGEWTDATNPLPNGTVGLLVVTGEKAKAAGEAEFDNFAVTQN